MDVPFTTQQVDIASLATEIDALLENKEPSSAATVALRFIVIHLNECGKLNGPHPNEPTATFWSLCATAFARAHNASDAWWCNNRASQAPDYTRAMNVNFLREIALMAIRERRFVNAQNLLDNAEKHLVVNDPEQKALLVMARGILAFTMRNYKAAQEYHSSAATLLLACPRLPLKLVLSNRFHLLKVVTAQYGRRRLRRTQDFELSQTDDHDANHVLWLRRFARYGKLGVWTYRHATWLTAMRRKYLPHRS